MLRIIQNASAAGAKAYYSTADYYSEGQELVGMWRGEGARRLSLTGEIQKRDWDALCDNLDPNTGKTLTLRQKEPRRIGYDFSFHVPKSVSALYALSGDERILTAFRDSVDETMRDVESEMQTRVRTGGRNEDRTTGNMVWGEYVHLTSRPVDGIPDPQLHAHCFVFNTTYDKAESRWKAGQFAGLKRDAPYFEAVFHSRLAERMTELGLQVERTPDRWEIAGIERSALDKLSRRKAQIEQLAQEKGITDPKKKDELGAKTREKKAKNIPLSELRSIWRSMLDDAERAGIEEAQRRLGGPAHAHSPDAAREAMELAAEHCFERSSVVPERKLLAEALKRSAGTASVRSVHDAYDRQGFINAERNGRRMVTTRGVLKEEQRMIAFARNGRSTLPALGKGEHRFKRAWLNEGQQKAVKHILGSFDRVILIRGAAGVGKTTMMQEAVEAIEASGTRVHTFAPSADASRGTLRNEGFENAETVARLMKDEELQQEVRGGVIWVDEAGLLGTKTMTGLFDLAEKLDARVILSGDRRQHGSVERGAALRLLETEAGLRPAEIKEIQRQKGEYKAAVRALSEGRTGDGFQRLDRMGWVREAEEAERAGLLAHDYLETVKAGKTAIIVSPTHREAASITDHVRDELKRTGRVGNDERSFATLRSANLTEAQRKDTVNYTPGDVLVFHQNAKGYKKGQRLSAQSHGEVGSLPVDQAARFQVFRRASLNIAPGDVVRVTQNGSTMDGAHRLHNGGLFTVKDFTEDGDIRLQNDWVVSKDYGHLAHGYVVTSHASQGKTVDRVFIGQSAESFAASSREQFYVSVSRGREQATVYTDSKEALLDAVDRSDERLSATELVTEHERRERVQTIRRQESLHRHDNDNAREREQHRELEHA